MATMTARKGAPEVHVRGRWSLSTWANSGLNALPYTRGREQEKKANANARGARRPIEQLGEDNRMPARCMHGDGVSR